MNVYMSFRLISQINFKERIKGEVKEKIDNIWINILYEIVHKTNL